MDRREELAKQLEQEHYEGMAADELARQESDAMWEFEGWTATDRLQVYITGMGLLRIPADEVVRFANAMLAEHQLHFTEEEEGHPCEECGRTDLPLHVDYRCPDHSRHGKEE